MKILFDQGTPAPLQDALTAHLVATANQMGWSRLRNGELLREAETLFDALITTDQSLRYQQNLSGRRLAILTLPTTSWPKLPCHLPKIAKAVDDLRPGDFVELILP
ncbi:MAG: hypothetical protein QOC81_4422 [Thermoanaerobaculia bacterium]|jgi:hypothetical protein|nr:hypothetical protein [Thermoanaerobaculia bacterium]